MVGREKGEWQCIVPESITTMRQISLVVRIGAAHRMCPASNSRAMDSLFVAPPLPVPMVPIHRPAVCIICGCIWQLCPAAVAGAGSCPCRGCVPSPLTTERLTSDPA